MSGIDGLSLDADGFVDMDQFPDDGSDLGGDDLEDLQAALRSDPLVEPTDEQWDAMFDQVMEGVDDGPFALDDADPGLDAAAIADDDAFDVALATEDDLDDPDVDVDDADLDDADLDDIGVSGNGFDPVDDVDLGVDPYDDGGLDLTPEPVHDDPFAADGVDDVPVDLANNDLEDFL